MKTAEERAIAICEIVTPMLHDHAKHLNQLLVGTIKANLESYSKQETAHLQKLCEEQRGEIERLKALGLGGTIQDILQKSERMYSQLATQTERVRIMTEALEFFKKEYHEPAVCQSGNARPRPCKACDALKALNQKESK